MFVKILTGKAKTPSRTSADTTSGSVRLLTQAHVSHLSVCMSTEWPMYYHICTGQHIDVVFYIPKAAFCVFVSKRFELRNIKLVCDVDNREKECKMNVGMQRQMETSVVVLLTTINCLQSWLSALIPWKHTLWHPLITPTSYPIKSCGELKPIPLTSQFMLTCTPISNLESLCCPFFLPCSIYGGWDFKQI